MAPVFEDFPLPHQVIQVRVLEIADPGGGDMFVRAVNDRNGIDLQVGQLAQQALEGAATAAESILAE